MSANETEEMKQALSEKPAAPSKTAASMKEKQTDGAKTASVVHKAAAQKSAAVQNTEQKANPAPKTAGVKPAAKPVVKADDAKPAAKPAVKVDGAKPAAKPVVKADGTKPAAKPAVKADGAKPAAKPAVKADGTKPAARPAAKTAGAKPAAKTGAAQTAAKSGVKKAVSASKPSMEKAAVNAKKFAAAAGKTGGAAAKKTAEGAKKFAAAAGKTGGAAAKKTADGAKKFAAAAGKIGGAAAKKASDGAKKTFAALKEAARKTSASAKKRAAEKKARKAALTPKQRARIRKRRREVIWCVVRRTLLCLFTVLALAVFGAYMLLGVIFKGPSQTAGDYLTISLLESSAGKFVPYLYYSREGVADIQERNKVVELEEKTDTSLIVINTGDDENGGDETEAAEEDDIVVETVTGSTYRGWMMIVKDPSRVSVGVSSDVFSEGQGGLRIGDMAEKYGAIAAINGGAFADDGGQGNGGMPEGLTISDGEIRKSKANDKHVTAAFTNDNVLVVGKFKQAEAEEMGLRDAVSFGPALIVNGEQAEVAGVSSGLNPRTAIGQRADGAVLLLVIDGRQVNSLGASMADLVDIMARYGAVNACNLDGGSSSNMYYDGEILNDGVAVTGSRRIPTTFIVR